MVEAWLDITSNNLLLVVWFPSSSPVFRWWLEVSADNSAQESLMVHITKYLQYFIFKPLWIK
jgi:hypothetical protein